MEINKKYTTSELEKLISKIYQKAEGPAKKDGTYKELDIRFENAPSGHFDGEYCFSDETGYHYRCLERGTITVDRITKDIFEITYWTIGSHIFWMSYEYERKNRINGQDNRRLMFSKRLHYFAALGEDYAKRAEYEIGETLKKAPFQDELFQ